MVEVFAIVTGIVVLTFVLAWLLGKVPVRSEKVDQPEGDFKDLFRPD